MPAVHEQRIERWLGADMFNRLRQASLGIHKPVPVANVPGHILLADGIFIGRISGGSFASLSDLIAEATSGKRQDWHFLKRGSNGVIGRSNSLWNVGTLPAAGGIGGTAGTGAVKTRTSTGALRQFNPSGADTLHLIGATAQASVSNQLLLLYDRLWDMTHTMTADQTVDSVNIPDRYQASPLSTGNFLSGEVTTVLAASSPNVTFTYVDQDGNTEETGPAQAIQASAPVNTVPFPVPNWYYPLNSDDYGLRKITNVDLSANMASGVVTWFIGHPLMWIPLSQSFSAIIIDGINTAFNLVQVLTDACLAFMEIAKGSSTATDYWGNIAMCSG